MEWWQLTNAGFVITAVVLAGLGAIGVIKAARKFGHLRELYPKFLCTRCNRYYRDIDTHLCYHRNDQYIRTKKERRENFTLLLVFYLCP
jgi:hypothetical protein